MIATVDILIDVSMEIENLGEAQNSAAQEGHAGSERYFEAYAGSFAESYAESSSSAESADYAESYAEAYANGDAEAVSRRGGDGEAGGCRR